VSRATKTLERVLRGTADANIGFDDLCSLLRHLGFAERIRGSHHIYTRDGVAEILNLQPKGSKAKPYQVRQVRGVIVSYHLAGEPEDEPSSPEETAEGTSGPASSEEGDAGQHSV
jgi:predicted RNA binding protein YcfA (HicA-like mRNA interferase family)